jgi:hypothetical protein
VFLTAFHRRRDAFRRKGDIFCLQRDAFRSRESIFYRPHGIFCDYAPPSDHRASPSDHRVAPIDNFYIHSRHFVPPPGAANTSPGGVTAPGVFASGLSGPRIHAAAPTTRRSKMAKNYYLPRDDSGKAQLLEHLARRLPAYAETLEVSAADIASLQADAEAFRHAIASTDSIQANARQWTAYKNLQRDGGVRRNPRPQLPHLPVPARDVAPGIVPRLIALAPASRRPTSTTRRSATTSRSSAPSSASPRRLEARPGHPQRGRPTGHQVAQGRRRRHRNLGRSRRRPGLPSRHHHQRHRLHRHHTPATGAVWKYKAIYRLRDAQVGQWSGVVSVAVGA